MNKITTIIRISILVVLLPLTSCDDYTENYPVPPASVVAKFTYTSSNGYSIPDTLVFANESIVPERAEPFTYLWNFGDGATSSEPNPTHIFSTAGMDTIKLTIYTPVDTVVAVQVQRFIKSARFKEDFEGITTIPNNWVLANIDGKMPDNPNYASMADSAWVIDNSITFGGNFALGISFYKPEASADDWMILPKVAIGENTLLIWDAMSLTTTGDYPDSYQIYVSTSYQDVAGCKANGVVFRVNEEEAGTGASKKPGLGIQNHSVNLSKRFAGKEVYVAFRLMTPAPGGDRLGIDNILIADE